LLILLIFTNLHVRLICAIKHLLTYLLTYSNDVMTTACVKDFSDIFMYLYVTITGAIL